MTPRNLENLTLDELCRDASRLLEQHGLLTNLPDGRVTAAPDPRTVRYYSTLGLVDRPRIEGREARYGWRHVLQVLAVKALQHLGLGLAEIQPRLYGISDEELESVLRAVAERRRARPAPPKSVLWREIVLAPGVKVLAQENASPDESPDALVEKFRAALAALNFQGEKK